jgi:hypothetical protein
MELKKVIHWIQSRAEQIREHEKMNSVITAMKKLQSVIIHNPPVTSTHEISELCDVIEWFAYSLHKTVFHRVTISQSSHALFELKTNLLAENHLLKSLDVIKKNVLSNQKLQVELIGREKFLEPLLLLYPLLYSFPLGTLIQSILNSILLLLLLHAFKDHHPKLGINFTEISMKIH